MKNSLGPTSIALATLACGAAATLLAWYLVGRQAETQARAEFASQSQVAANIVQGRVQRHIDLLFGLDAFAQHAGALTRAQFHTYAKGLDFGNRFPGLQAVEFIRKVPHEARAAFVEAVRTDRSLRGQGYPGFDITPPGERAEYWVIDFVEPLDGNEPAFGLDLRTRAAVPAAERSRDTGEPSMTGRYRLAQEAGGSLGLVMYLPVYATPEPLSESARREALTGFVNVVLRVDDLFAGILGEHAFDGLQVALHDLGPLGGAPAAPSADTRLFATAEVPGEPAGKTHWYEWRPHGAREIPVAGRLWHLQLQSQPRLLPWLEPLPLLVLGAGLAVSLLLFGILRTIARSRSDALALAHRATLELRTQLSFTQQLIEAIPNPVFFKDAAGRYLGCNEAFESYAGVPREELIGKTVFDILPQDLADRSQLADAQLFGRPGTHAYEANVAVARGASRRDVIVNKATFYDASGAVAGLVGVVVDITQRKQLEAVTAETNERLRAVIEAAPLAIIARDLESVIRMWNPAAERMFGWAEEEVLETGTSIVPERLREETAVLRKRAQQGETIWIEDTQRVHRDGHLIDVSMSIAPIYGADSKVIGTMVTIADISRRKQAEQALRESEAHLRLAMDAAQMGMWYWEADSDRFTYSDGLNVLFGRRADAPLIDYRRLQESMHAEDRELFDATLRHAIKKGTDF
ncbi:MAG TPA: CHASE domain-containing protein, partial [Usitatibacter sp.]|nr:CHASE domain-containing protein [Usitatibacter sp.]